ncbi:MAG: sigma-70 family RNA polymerase sigma factor [Alphaproteobacteria bacterium]|nr:sigma-70 family RNA polymerase sigma factor [Alphaproteobacteria bacterium]
MPRTKFLQDTASLEEHIPALRRYAQKLAHDPDDAADIVQTCLERALRNFHMYQQGTNLRSWLFTILHNEFISEVRKRTRRGASVPLEEWHDPGTRGGQEQALEMNEFRRAFGALAPRDREILQMVGVEGRSYASTGKRLKLEIGTVKSRVFRARERLRTLLEAGEPQVAA